MQKSYVLIFRQGSRKLTAEEQWKRSEEVRAWALQQIQEGRDFDPRVLESEAKTLGDETNEASDHRTVIALNLFKPQNSKKRSGSQRPIPV